MEARTDDKGWPNGSLSFTKEEAAEMGFGNVNIKAFLTSAEAVSDLLLYHGTIGRVRAGDISEQDALTWEEWDQKFATMDLDTIRGRMTIEGRDDYCFEDK
jgi:hypothetical protein